MNVKPLKTEAYKKFYDDGIMFNCGVSYFKIEKAGYTYKIQTNRNFKLTLSTPLTSKDYEDEEQSYNEAIEQMQKDHKELMLALYQDIFEG